MRKDVENELHFVRREGLVLNKSAFARRFECSRQTVNRYLSENTKQNDNKSTRKSKLDDFKEIVIDKVDNWSCSAVSILKFIQKKGYSGKYGTVNNFVKYHKKDEQNKATIRFETNKGLQAQVDWKESFALYNKHGKEFKINIFLMVLGYSRYKFFKITDDKTQKTLFLCMIKAFSFMSGIPHEILFDNMATVINRDISTFRSIKLNSTFEAFANDAGFVPILCRPYRPQTKGKVETLARLCERLKVYNNEFETFEDLEKIVDKFNQEINEEICQSTGQAPVLRYKEETEYLLSFPPMDLLLSYLSTTKEYKVSKESMVTYKGQKYSVPTHLIGKLVTVEDNGSQINIYYTSHWITSHTKSDKFLNYKVSHVKEILKSDAFKHKTDNEIDEFIENNLKSMDIFLE